VSTEPGAAQIELNNVPGLWGLWFERADRNVKLDEPSLSCDSLLAAVQMAESAIGVLLAPFPLMDQIVASGRLTPLSHYRLSVETNDFYLLYRRGDANLRKIKAVRRWLSDIATEMAKGTKASDL
jgi:DNA-binding transcriptional LysR family regulator